MAGPTREVSLLSSAFVLLAIVKGVPSSGLPTIALIGRRNVRVEIRRTPSVLLLLGTATPGARIRTLCCLTPLLTPTPLARPRVTQL